MGTQHLNFVDNTEHLEVTSCDKQDLILKV